MRATIEILTKNTEELVYREFADKWMNPESYMAEITDTGLRPDNYEKAYKMLINMINGDVYFNDKYIVRVQGVYHKRTSGRIRF